MLGQAANVIAVLFLKFQEALFYDGVIDLLDGLVVSMNGIDIQLDQIRHRLDQFFFMFTHFSTSSLVQSSELFIDLNHAT
jgi:hypothetical protein